MIDWSARAERIFAETPQGGTDKTDETTRCRVSSVSSVGGEGVFPKNEVSSTRIEANQWEVRYPDGRVRVVAFAPARTLEEVSRRYPDAVTSVETASTAPACVRCVHVSTVGNCGVPERAGLAKRFMIVAHPSGGSDCAAFEGAE